jgi:hypothetical protein
MRNGAAKVGASAVILNPVEQSKSTVKALGEAVASRSATQTASASVRRAGNYSSRPWALGSRRRPAEC